MRVSSDESLCSGNISGRADYFEYVDKGGGGGFSHYVQMIKCDENLQPSVMD